MTNFRFFSIITLLIGLFTMIMPAYSANAIVSDCANFTGTGTISDAVAQANAGGGTITFACSGTIFFDNELPITNNVTLTGGGNITFDGGDTTRLFFIRSGGALTVSGITFQNGFATDGGAISTESNGGMPIPNTWLTVTDSQFNNNRASTDGGAFYTLNGSINITNTTFSNNHSGRNGGAMFIVSGGSLNISATTFVNNQSGNAGGALALNGTLYIRNSVFRGNSSLGGGAIWNYGNIFVDSSLFEANTANIGGAIYYLEAQMTVTNNTFYNNQATIDGGAIHFMASIGLYHNTFVNNRAGGNGQAIFNSVDNSSSASYNIFAGAGACYLNVSYMNATNLADAPCASATVVPDLMLGAFNGQVVPLLAGSPAIDSYTIPCYTAIDQLGTARPQFGGCDAGAYEFPDPTQPNTAPAPIIWGTIFDTSNGVQFANAPDNTYHQMLMKNEGVLNYSGAVPANLIDLGVILATEVYRLDGGMSINTFPDYVRVCLAGQGRLFYMDARNAPRIVIELDTENVDGATCGWIPAPGTLILTN